MCLTDSHLPCSAYLFRCGGQEADRPKASRAVNTGVCRLTLQINMADSFLFSRLCCHGKAR